ncbi:MAG: DNA glycosylase [Frankiaceae bacterium]|nr:DNA glycosylase [Frankiaceae bacterium]MBV9871547.1 DNA glycosylase [Frankiaceae bacterium]
MPEGDTVWLSANRMHDALAGRVLTTTDFRVPQHATADLTGLEVLEVVPRGKHMLTRIEGGTTLHTHFKMAGTWRIFTPGARRSGGKDHEIRVILANAEREAIGYRLQLVELIRTDQEDTVVGHLGPDLLGPDWDADEALRRLLAAPEREIGDALLDQRNLAGIGNLYKTEVLFLSGLTPWTTVAAVPDLPAMVRRARKLLVANKSRWVQTTTGNLRRDELHWVFERHGRPCRRCGTIVRRAMQGPDLYDRICYWCPSCQAGPSPSGSSAAASRPA